MSRIIEKALVAERFRRTLASYSHHAVVQQAMATELVAMLQTLMPEQRFQQVLEVGSGTGMLMEQLLLHYHVKRYYANDLVRESTHLLRTVQHRCQLNDFHFLEGDIEALQELPEQLDLVISNATIQWLHDLPAFFSRMKRVLQPNGVMACTTFGNRNLHEIATVTGVGLHYHSLVEIERVASQFFTVVKIVEEERQLEFPSPEQAFHHLRQTGVNGIVRQRWTKSHYHQMIERYRLLFSTNNGVTLTYHPMYLVMVRGE